MFAKEKQTRTSIKVRPRRQPKREIKRVKSLFNFLLSYCNRSSLHGLRYIVDFEIHWVERFIWLILFVVSTFYASNVIYMLATRFQAAPTATVVESTNYKISALPFPSVTICPVDRVDWQKALDLERKIIATNDTEAVTTFRQLLTALSSISFGDFDVLSFLKNRSLQQLIDVNITRVLLDVTPSCEDLFSSCWWRYADRDCCEIFELQKTEYGFCYSFNSNMAESNGTRRRTTDEVRPRRSSSYGDWSGIKATVNLSNVVVPPNSKNLRGVVLIVNHPSVWPSNGRSTTIGMLINVSVKCSSIYVTERVLQLDKDKVPCMHIPGEIYQQETCLSLCRREHVVKYCGCNPSFFFPVGQTRECTVTDFICLADLNEIFNNLHDSKSNGYIFDDNPAMSCDCPTECEYYDYSTEIFGTPILEQGAIVLDVHFNGPTSIRYRTDVVYTGLDLLVSFGGIIGLFLGGSLLSAAELMYTFTVGVFYYFYRRKDVDEDRITVGKSAFTISGVLPLLDYPSVKPKLNEFKPRVAVPALRSYQRGHRRNLSATKKTIHWGNRCQVDELPLRLRDVPQYYQTTGYTDTRLYRIRHYYPILHA